MAVKPHENNQAPSKPAKKVTLTEAQLGQLLVTPAALFILIVAFLPVLVAFWLSLHKYNLRFATAARPFIGLANYARILADRRLWNSIKITSIFLVATVSAEFVLGLLFALVLNRKFRGRGIVRTAVLVPWALTTVVMARMWAWIYNSEYGIFNAILKWLGIIERNIPWVADTDFALIAAIVADVWKTTPFMALLLLAGLQTIPNELHEAAMVDGANWWQRFWKIVIPMLKPTILVSLLFRSLDAARVFDLLFVLTGGGPGFATESLALYTYRTLMVNLDFGYGSALAVITFLYVMLIAVFYIKVLGTQTQR